MRRSKWILLVVLVAVIAVSALKAGTKHRPATPSAASPTKPATRGAGPLPGSALPGCLKNGRPTMADFGKEWCVPCKAMVPVLQAAAEDYAGKVNIVFVNLEDDSELGLVHKIATMPTQIFFDAKGKEVSRHIGYLDNAGISAELAKAGLDK